MNEDDIKNLALEMDVALTQLCITCNNQPLILSGVLLARLTHFNDFLGCGKDFRDLCKYPEEKKSTEIPLVAASERGPALKLIAMQWNHLEI